MRGKRVTRRDLWAWLVHLRLVFQVLLSPIFLWGFLIAGGTLGPALLLGYLSFHLFGYAGGTAFNSYYDRDTGPIGGLEYPPPIPHGLLPFSIAWQAIGFVLALFINLTFTAIYVTMACLSFAYSHPRIRLKSRPLAGLATVAVGQGILGALGGWACARGDILSALNPFGLVAMGSVTLLTVGLFPLTEIYQIAEDRLRGDRTLPVWLGAAPSFRFSLACLIVGGIGAIGVVALRYPTVEAALLALYLLMLIALIGRWAAHFDVADVHGNYRMIMRLYATLSLGFIGWIGLHLTFLR